MSSDSETHASPSWSQVDPVALLAGVDLFADVTPDELSRLAASCKMRTFYVARWSGAPATTQRSCWSS